MTSWMIWGVVYLFCALVGSIAVGTAFKAHDKRKQWEDEHG